MGIDCRLWRSEGAIRARRRLKSALADRVCAAAANLSGRLDGCGELYGADSRHRRAGAERESVVVRSRVGIDVGIFFLKRSRRLCSESWSWGWAAQRRNNVRRRAECRICTGGMTG